MHMVHHARQDHVAIGPGPFDGARDAFLMADARDESELVPRLGDVGETLAGAVPVARRRHCDRRCVAGQAVDALGKFADGGFDAGSKIVDFAGLARERAGDEAARHVLDEDEIA